MPKYTVSAEITLGLLAQLRTVVDERQGLIIRND